MITNADGLGLFEFGLQVQTKDGSGDLAAGERVRIDSTLQNPLAPGRHHIHCGIQSARGGDVSAYLENVFDFVVFGGLRPRPDLDRP